MRKKLDILYEDAYLIALNKPPGMLSIPDRYIHHKPNLKDILIRQYGEIYVLHRLDVDTSGAILYAKTAQAHSAMSLLFAEQSIEKIYWALTVKPRNSGGIIDAPIAESMKYKGRYKVHNRGKKAVTKYEIIDTWRQYALLQLDLITGRTHQIRVHLKHLGAPLLSDDKYGLSDQFFLSQIKKIRMNRDQVERPLLNRTSLHARIVRFRHPHSGIEVEILAPLPKDMKAAIYQLNKNYGSDIKKQANGL